MLLDKSGKLSIVENFSLYFTTKFTTNFIMFGDKFEQFAIYQILSVAIGIFEI